MKPQVGIVLGFTLLVLLVGCGEDMEDDEDEVITDVPAKQRVEIADPVFRRMFEIYLGKENGAVITAEEMGTLKKIAPFGSVGYYGGAGGIKPDDAGISVEGIGGWPQSCQFEDLTGLNFATNLTELAFTGPYCIDSDLTPLAGLTQLEKLDLETKATTGLDLTPLAELTRLKLLAISNDRTGGGTDLIEDLTPLAGLTQLEALIIPWHTTSHGTLKDGPSRNTLDLTPLAGLTNLTFLQLSGYNITDLTPLAGLTQLKWLQLGVITAKEAPAPNLTPLAKLINLVDLDLTGNNITDISPLAGLTNLTHLDLDYNDNITDISPLSGLTKLVELRMFESLWQYENICDIPLWAPIGVEVTTDGLDCGP